MTTKRLFLFLVILFCFPATVLAGLEMGLEPDSTWPDSVTLLDQNYYGSTWEIGAFVYDGEGPDPGGGGRPYSWGLEPTSTWPDNVATLDQDEWGTGWEIGAYVYPEDPGFWKWCTIPITQSTSILGQSGMGKVFGFELTQ